MKKLFMSAFILAALILNSCSDDESPKLQFVAGDKTISLKGANLYLTYEGSYDNRTYRDYFITDGTFTNGDGNNGWSLDDYEGATYYLAFEIASVVEGELDKGEFPNYSNWDLPADNSRISYLYFESGTGTNYIEIYPEYNGDYEGETPLEVSGGIDDGQKMTIKFKGGSLEYYYYDGANWVEETVTADLYFSGKVKDERAL